MASLVEQEVMWGRRAFPKAQELFAGTALRRLPLPVATGWHDTATNPESGAFALIAVGAGLDDLIGEVLRVSAQGRSVYVYCLASADLPTPLSLARRAFCALAVLALESVDATVELIA